MTRRYPPINPKCPHLLHGGDYNPDQWLTYPGVIDEDMRLMKLAGCNAMSIGIFSWMALEPREGEFTFDWMDDIMDRLADNGAYAVLATPSGAKPTWMSIQYPEVRRVNAQGIRDPHGYRHNHCFSSPVYREKVSIVNRKLAERYKDHPALLVWHISNEYNGECFCETCKAAFRDWLRAKYDNDIETLNEAWWSRFWAHTFTDFEQIIDIDGSVHGMKLDWQRFVTDQTLDFMLHELKPIRELTPDVPVTTNMMGIYQGLNYVRLAEACDVISWDSYPMWHGPGGNVGLAARIAFVHDVNRGMKDGKPFMLMESVPSATNWQPVAKLKRPGMHLLSSLQAVAHGSDTVQYFQYRKSRGSSEKFHGAIVDHLGTEHNRVFRDVADVGATLAKLDDVVGATTPAEVAIVHDWENSWAITNMGALGHKNRKYAETVQEHYASFWKRGIPVDVIDETKPLDGYKLLVLPMLYMLRPGMAEKVKAFVAGGGTAVMTYWSGLVDENDLCHLGGWPGEGLREVFGIWDEETDGLYPEDRNRLAPVDGNELGLVGQYEVHELCALIHAETADVLATYGEDFYAGRPALTVNRFGEGKAYYIAARTGEDFLDDFYAKLTTAVDVQPALDADLPETVTVSVRTDGQSDFLFVQNYSDSPADFDLPEQSFVDMLSGEAVAGRLELGSYGLRILRTPV